MKMLGIFNVVCLVGMLHLLQCPALHAQHGSWQDKYRSDVSVGSTPCCGPRDCKVVAARLVREDKQMLLVEVNGAASWIPRGSVFPSEDGSDWACYTLAQAVRCLFIAIGT